MFNKERWEEKKREKILGYIIRFFAVIIWGVQPIYIKYTAMNTISLDYRVLLIGMGRVLSSIVILFIFLFFVKI